MLTKCALMQCIESVDLDGDYVIWVDSSIYAGVKNRGSVYPPKDPLYSTVMLHRCRL